MMSHLVAPSILSADFSNLGKDIQMLNNSEADWFHLDIMDGVFVPNISFGFTVLKYIKQLAKKPLDVHLMIVQPDRYFDRFKKFGADIISVHYEACTHLHRDICTIKENGIKAGVVLNPHTNVSMIFDIVKDVDVVLLMSVNPGYGGQKFINNTYSKISALKDMIIQKSSDALIEVDGGVSPENAGKLVECGADVLVAGDAIFSSEDPVKVIHNLKHL